jgi:type IV pilus assembly protein PilP
MNAQRLLPLALAAGLAACGGKPPPPRAAAAPVAAPAAAAPAAAAAPEAKKPAEPEWSYSSAGKRDPFRTYLADLEKSQSGLTTRCATPLGRYEVEQLKIVAVITGLEDPVAMVEAPNGVGYAVRRGACIGKNGGVVAAIRSGEIIVTEWAVRADGTRDRAQTVLRFPAQPAMNLEE